MSKEFKKVKTIEIPIYSFYVTFFLVSKNKSLINNAAGLCSLQENSNIFVYLTSNDISVMVHELFHAVELIMREVGEKKSSDECDESWAYLLQYLTKEGLAFIGKK